MKKTAIPAALLCMALLAGCAGGGEETQQSASPPSEEKAVTELYSGYEQLQGKDFQVFTMPELITPQSIGRLYTFTINKRFTVENEENGKRVFRAFWGEDFDESKCGFSHSEGDPSYQYDENGEEYGYFYNGLISLQRPEAGRRSDAAQQTVYSAAADRDIEVTLAGGSVSIGELTDSAVGFVKESGIEALYDGFTVQPAEVFVFGSDKGICAEVICSAVLDGVPAETYVSPYFKESYENGRRTVSHYLFKYLSFTFSGRGKMVSAYVPESYQIYEKKELSSAIGLSDAAELLKGELAEYSGYRFTDVKLMYCSLSSRPSDEGYEDDPEALSRINEEIMDMHEEFVPTWCFTFTSPGGGRGMIKVNAVTGEITVDA